MFVEKMYVQKLQKNYCAVIGCDPSKETTRWQHVRKFENLNFFGVIPFDNLVFSLKASKD